MDEEQSAAPDTERGWAEAAAIRQEIAQFKPGLYRHYKGGLYTALGLVSHHHTRLPMVKYISHTYGGENVRPLNGWPEDPDGWNDLMDQGEGAQVRRFTFLGELPSDTPIVQR